MKLVLFILKPIAKEFKRSRLKLVRIAIWWQCNNLETLAEYMAQSDIDGSISWPDCLEPDSFLHYWVAIRIMKKSTSSHHYLGGLDGVMKSMG